MHITGKFPKGHKCSEKCDQVKLYEYLNKKKINLAFFCLSSLSQKYYQCPMFHFQYYKWQNIFTRY